MPRQKKRPSRFSPAFLASRHAGAVFFFTALGLALGAAWHVLVQPTRYRSEARIDASLVPADAASRFDWDGKLGEWRTLLEDDRERALLGNNLRYLAKLAFTERMRLDTETFAREIAAFDAPQEYSASLFGNPLAARLGPTLTVSRRDLAANLDFQSLAAIISDLDPPSGATNWDFSFFHAPHTGESDADMVTRPGAEDRFFRVFRHLYGIVHPGRTAVSPEDAWRTAVDTLNGRLERETQFEGGGGFGHTAKRELLREIVSLPILAANALYRVNAWSYGDGDFSGQIHLWEERWKRGVGVDLTRRGDAGQLAVSANMDLYPLAQPRDTALTRLPPLTAFTLLAHISAREKGRAAPAAKPVPVAAAPLPPPEPASETAPVPEPPVSIPEPAPEEPVVDENAEAARRENLLRTEQSLHQARLAFDAAKRRLETARANEKRLTMEAIAARTRADRLSERYDAASATQEKDYKVEITPEAAKILRDRDAVLEKLTALLQYCTEEHPFVKQARRELAALDAMLANHGPPAGEASQAEARATRLANLFIELETALAAADGVEERRRRQSDAVACILGEVSDAEARSAGFEREIARLRSIAPPAVKPAAVVVPAAVPPPPPMREMPEPAPLPATQAISAPQLAFSTLPTRIPLFSAPPSRLPLLLGAALGLCLGLLWALLRSAFATRFRNAGDAALLLPYPILAALPAYDPKAVREAAKGMKGELTTGHGKRRAFIPLPLEMAEPPAVGRRGKLTPAGKRRGVALWVAGILLALCAVLLETLLAPALPRSGPGLPSELPLPTPIVYSAPIPPDDGEDGEWGDLP